MQPMYVCIGMGGAARQCGGERCHPGQHHPLPLDLHGIESGGQRACSEAAEAVERVEIHFWELADLDSFPQSQELLGIRTKTAVFNGKRINWLPDDFNPQLFAIRQKIVTYNSSTRGAAATVVYNA